MPLHGVPKNECKPSFNRTGNFLHRYIAKFDEEKRF